MEITTMEQWIAKKIGVSTLTPEILQSYQLQKINATVDYALCRSAFYRDHLAGLNCRRITWQSFQRLPFTTAEQLQFQGKKMVCVPQEEIHRIVTLQTSGTTARPKRLFFTLEDQELTIDFFANGMQVLTKPRENVLILLPAQTPGCVGDLLAAGLERFGAIPHRYGIPTDFSDTLDYIIDRNIQTIVANPEHMLAIANLAEQQHRAPRLHSILLSTDYVADSLMRQLAKTFNAAIYEHYGMTEMGLGGGVSCQALKGYHLREADLYFEIIDPLTGINLPAGKPGEIVFTTLTRRAMPLIRYRTGDYGRFLTAPCPCGTKLRLLDKVYHRLDAEAFKITDFDEALFAVPNLFNYDLAIDKTQRQINLTIHTLTNDDSVAALAKKAVAPLCQNYQIAINTAVGLMPQHYQLIKRKIHYHSSQEEKYYV